ncbi:hypothetical protein JTB14_025188 [Gonioctena quinquepunctata]|nr:hypothetical protein JTB14_025188 [Gonioctena quinquepunctata]
MSSRRPLSQAELEAELENFSDFSDVFEPFDDDIGDPNYDTESNSPDSSDGNDQTAGEMHESIDVDLDENMEDVEEINSELDIWYKEVMNISGFNFTGVFGLQEIYFTVNP